MSTEALAAAGSDNDMFMQLLMAQLQNQNPMEPMSNTDMVNQLAQLTAVDTMNELRVSFADMLHLQQLLSGTELIGRTVEYELNGGLQEGVVESVLNRETGLKLLIDGQEVDLDQVTEIL